MNVSTTAMKTTTDTVSKSGTTRFNEQSLYKVGGAAAMLCALMYVITLAVYLPAYRAAPPPDTVLEWFTLFENSEITGLFFLGLADIIIMILWCPMALALYAALKPSNQTWAKLATTLIFVGVAVYLATNMAFSMLSLSHKYAAATTDTDKSIILAAGQAMIAVSEGTGGQYAGMPLVWLSGLIISVVMLRSNRFGRATAWVGIVGLVLLLASVPFAGYTTIGPTTAAVSAIVAVSYMGGGLLSLAWYILVGRKLLELGHLESKLIPQVSQVEKS